MDIIAYYQRDSHASCILSGVGSYFFMLIQISSSVPWYKKNVGLISLIVSAAVLLIIVVVVLLLCRKHKFGHHEVVCIYLNFSVSHDFDAISIRERSLFMAGVGTEEKALYSLKKVLPHHLLKSDFLYNTEGKQ